MVLAERASFSSLPPTSNTLTPAERAHRRRSANKVGRVLGITPQIMDLGSTAMTDHYWSMTSAMISSHVSLPAIPYSTSTEFEDEWYPYNDATFGESKRTMKSTSMHRPPLLRVARSAHFHPLSKFKFDPHAPAGLGEADDDSLPELSTSSSSEEDDISDPPSPTLSAPSTVAMRRRKMERLQRLLGEDVPVSMVFPENRTDKSGLARDDVDVNVRTPVRTLRSTRSRRPQTAPAGSTRIFSTVALEEPLPKNRITTTNAPPPRADKRPGSAKSATSPVQESVPVSPPAPVLQKARRKRPVTPHPHYYPKSFFQNGKPSESAKPATSPAQESVPVSPPAPVLQKTPGRKRPVTPNPHYRPQSSFQNNNKTQPATAAKYSYIYYPNLSASNSNLPCGDGKTTPIMEFGEAQCLRTIIESPEELESVLAQESGGLCSEDGQEGRSSSGTSSTDVSLASDWDSTSTGISVGDRSGAAAVKHDEIKDPASDAGSGAAEPACRPVWRHKRKPPPVYEP